MVKKLSESLNTDYEELNELTNNFASIGEVCNDMVNAFYWDNLEEFTASDIKETINFIKSKLDNIENIVNDL